MILGHKAYIFFFFFFHIVSNFNILKAMTLFRGEKKRNEAQ